MVTLGKSIRIFHDRPNSYHMNKNSELEVLQCDSRGTTVADPLYACARGFYGRIVVREQIDDLQCLILSVRYVSKMYARARHILYL